MFGSCQSTTNNRMEMQAAIEALKALQKPSAITIKTDSRYLINGITKWIKGWKKRQWITQKREPVKNADLWRELDALCQIHEVKWTWVKGHSGNPGNERADELACRGRDHAALGHTVKNVEMPMIEDDV